MVKILIKSFSIKNDFFRSSLILMLKNRQFIKIMTSTMKINIIFFMEYVCQIF